jgi:hypothetical protein
MNKEEILQVLIDNKVIFRLNDEYFLIDKKTNKVKGGKCKNLPDKYLGVTSKQSYKYFMEDCEIPFFSSGNLVYSLREESIGALAVLKTILENPTIDYLILVSKIKSFYKLPGKTTVHPKFSKFLETGVWEGVYESKINKNNNDEYVDSM